MPTGASVIAKRITGTGNVTSDDVRLVGLWIAGATSGGRLTLKDTDNSGNVQLDIDTPGNNQLNSVVVPENGIPFPGGVHASTFTNLAGATLFYEKRKS